MLNKPAQPVQVNLNMRIVDALAFQLFSAVPTPESVVVDWQSKWREALPECRSQYRTEATGLIAGLFGIGIELRTIGKKGDEALQEFIADLMTHPARPAYDASEIGSIIG